MMKNDMSKFVSMGKGVATCMVHHPLPAGLSAVTTLYLVPVQRLFRNGDGASPGDYTGAGGPASARVSPFISGTGILRVAKGPVGFQVIFR